MVTTDSLDGCDVSPSNKSATHLEVMPGQSFSYLVHAYNAGDADCGQTIVTDTLPAGTTFVSCQPDCQSTGQEVVFTLDELAAGQAVDLTITVTAPDQPTTDMTNVATIQPTNGSSTQVSTGSRTSPTSPSRHRRTRRTSHRTPVVSAREHHLPRTGGGVAFLALGTLAAAGALRRRR